MTAHRRLTLGPDGGTLYEDLNGERRPNENGLIPKRTEYAVPEARADAVQQAALRFREALRGAGIDSVGAMDTLALKVTFEQGGKTVVVEKDGK